MASRSTITSLSRHRPSPTCSHALSWRPSEARGISQSYLNKQTSGAQRWKIRSEKIENGELPHLWDVLNERGYIKDHTSSPDRIRRLFRVKRVGAYVGIDPTADSMHVGHILPMMPLFWMWFHGHPAATLIGGATARIGDPTGRLESREMLSNADIGKNITKIHFQLSRIWANVEHLKRKYGYEEDWAAKHHLLNNSFWLQKLTMYDFTKRLARHVRIGPMLGKETVRRKMTDGDGMSLGEFIYPLFQAWDWWHLYDKLGIQVQIGGSDQFGNLSAGAEAFRTLRQSEEVAQARPQDDWKHEPVGFTVPLITDSGGNKIGKSAGNAVWLDEFKTSAFDLYGYFMRRTDDEVESLLKLFTFMPTVKVNEVMEEHRKDPAKRVAQHTLAFDVLSLVHGSQTALEEAQQHNFRFGGSLPHVIKEPTKDSGIVTQNNAPRSDITLPRSVMELSPARLLFAVGLADSNSDGQRLVKAQGAYVAGAPGQKRGLLPGSLTWTPMKMWFPEETAKFLIDDRMLIMRKGKHNVRIVELVSDEDWKESGKTYPGEPYTGKVRMIKETLKEEIRLAAAAAGEELSEEEIKQRLNEKFNNAIEPLTVANNPGIELPDKGGLRQRAELRKKLMLEKKQEERAARKKTKQQQP